MAGKFDINDPKNKKIVIAVFLGIALIVGFYYLLLSPQGEVITGLETEVNQKKAEYSRLVALEKRVADLKAEIENNNARIEIAKKLLPTQQELPKLLREVTYASQSADLSLESFKPGKLEPKGDYLEFRIDLSLKGNFHSLGYFLSNLSLLPRIINVGDISISGVSGSSSSQTKKTHTISSSLNLVAYIYNEKK